MEFGKYEIEFITVPGHTEGCLAMFFVASDGNKNVKVGYYGGFGFNTLTKDYIDEFGVDMRKVYVESIKKVINRKVELYLGNHCVDNNTLLKAELAKQSTDVNPFIDDKLWKKYLSSKLDELKTFNDKNPL